MKTTIVSLAYLFNCVVVSTLARVTDRATLPDVNSILSLNASLNADPKLKIPPSVPYEIKQSTAQANGVIRLTGYSPPHISSFDLLPCIVDMLSFAYDGAWAQNLRIEDNTYTCQKYPLEIKIVGNQMGPLEYADLVILAKAIVQFQQVYILPGVDFQFVAQDNVIGDGSIRYMLAAEKGGRRNGTESVETS